MSTNLNGSSPEALERVVRQQREELAKTIDALQAKLDFRSKAKHKADDLRKQPALLAGAAVALTAVVALVVWRRRR